VCVSLGAVWLLGVGVITWRRVAPLRTLCSLPCSPLTCPCLGCLAHVNDVARVKVSLRCSGGARGCVCLDVFVCGVGVGVRVWGCPVGVRLGVVLV
jgi:hypothetical protein